MLIILLLRSFYIYWRDVGIPFDIKANLLAVTRNGNINFVLLLDLKVVDKISNNLLEGSFISLQIVLIAFAPWNIS